ncbi:MAG: aldehyde:ferredoxin oxidoreductase [Planctomycetota bacterium]|jgi:aldehyde:ferredoxin oxidoreductase
MEGLSRSSPSPAASSSGDAQGACTARVLQVDLGRAWEGSLAPRRLILAGGTKAGESEETLLSAPWLLGQAAAERLASWGGTALGLVLLASAQEDLPSDQPEPFVLAVGSAVGRGVPTAARASVLARAPQTGLLGMGQVGSDLGAQLAHSADALVIQGRTELPGAVLVIGGDGARLESLPTLVGRTPAERIRLLDEAYGSGASLTVGSAADVGIPFASLAAGSIGAALKSGEEKADVVGKKGGRPSLVGRGGLGAVLARTGLGAIHVLRRAEVLRPSATDALGQDEADQLSAALRRSPRLAQRSQSGSLELFAAEQSRLAEAQQSRGAGGELVAVQRHGCRGCPTPCGWSFRRSAAESKESAAPQAGRFAALRGLGEDLGLSDPAAALELLARCDDYAVDAKELGTLLELLVQAHRMGQLSGPALFGDLTVLLQWVDILLSGKSLEGLGFTGLEAELILAARSGAQALAASLALENPEAHGSSVRRIARGEPRMAALVGESRGIGQGVAGGLALLVGQCTSTGGADPMRTFPFLLEVFDREDLEKVVGCALPEGADDPGRPEGKGLLACWHQNFVAGVDLTGFCAFSAAGLVADGVLSLVELAEAILPKTLQLEQAASWAGLNAGERLLAAGANVALFARALDDHWARAGSRPGFAPMGEARDRPAWAAAELDHPELLPTHRRLRGIDGRGCVTPEALAGLGSPGPGFSRDQSMGPADAGSDGLGVLESSGTAVRGSASRGTVLLRAQGPLSLALQRSAVLGVCEVSGDGFLCALGESSSLGGFLAELGEELPDLARLLMIKQRLLPAVWRAGRRLRSDAILAPGDELDLVLAIAGG